MMKQTLIYTLGSRAQWSRRFTSTCGHCIYIIGLLWGLTGCSLPTSSSMVVDQYPIYKSEWAIAVDTLAARGVPMDRLSPLKWTMFTYRTHNGAFNCDGEDPLDNGCFSSGLIRWNTKTPSVLRHEMGHGILRKLGYGCWAEYEHTTQSCPVSN
jgi:hypothetical protein